MMFIPDAIMYKEGPLNEAEWAIIRQHPIFACELLSSNTFSAQVIDIPLYHHERWDGGGYPHGLAGEQIPLPARIFAVIDTWDALRSDRLYRKVWPAERVISFIISEAGRRYDPLVVEMFLKMIA
jgi:HD-GYP domain-containing protein (c-di-GMP phosphodiesterase class II)